MDVPVDLLFVLCMVVDVLVHNSILGNISVIYENVWKNGISQVKEVWL